MSFLIWPLRTSMFQISNINFLSIFSLRCWLAATWQQQAWWVLSFGCWNWNLLRCYAKSGYRYDESESASVNKKILFQSETDSTLNILL